MARYSLTFADPAIAAFADTTALTNNAYACFLGGGGASQHLKISEVYIGGEAASSAPSLMKLARDSTVAVTPAAGDTRNALVDPTSTAPGTVAATGNSASTAPQRSSTLHLLALSLNLYGGIVRWVARHGEEIGVYGNTASLGEVSLSAFTGSTTGNASGHLLYEVL